MSVLNWKIFWRLMLLLLVFQGCTGAGGEKRLDIKISNLSSGEIDKTEVWFGKGKASVGILGIGGSKTQMYFEKPITAKAVVKWVDSKREKQERTVDISKVYDFKASGELYFEIGNDAVKVRFNPAK